MLAPINWLKEYTNIDLDVKEFARRMTLSGTMVEGVKDLSEGISGVITGKITKIVPHEDADSLVVCTLFDGENDHQIVTGAKNVKEGDIVPFATIGATLAGGLKIKKSKLRGVESFGMLCSGGELNMSSSVMPKGLEDGVYVFSEEVPLGIDARLALGIDDIVFDFELTNNRSDCNSIVGIAYEAAATLGNKFILDEAIIEDSDNKIDSLLTVNISAKDLCSRYVARVLNVVEVKPSPLWMQKRLMSVGIRPISNIVDVSNYVMMELGQPLHMFDYDKVSGGSIYVDTGEEGEKFITLDGNERVLNEGMIVIKDSEKTVAVAGVMGGLNSEIDSNTKRIVIESATFDKHSIRNTSKLMGIRSESSAHFEKGVNENLAVIAANKAAKLLIEIGACELIEGIIDKGDFVHKETKITISTKKVNEFLGTDITKEEQVKILDNLLMEPVLEGEDITITSPKLRSDIIIKEDVYEEIARIYGYDKIPSTLIDSSSYISPKNEYYENKKLIKETLKSLSGCEILTYSFTSMDIEKRFDYKDERENKIEVINPLGEDTSVMRSTILGGMLEALQTNYNRKNSPRLLFEIGNVYLKGGEVLPLEKENLIIGKFASDYFYLKGVVEHLLKRLKIEGVTFKKAEEPTLHPGRSAYIYIKEEFLGYIGNVHPSLLSKYGIKAETVVAELDVKLLDKLYIKDKKYQSLPKYPSSERDLAIVVGREIYSGDLIENIKENGGKYLVGVEVFDVYEGSQIEEGKKSIAFSLKFRSEEKTLVDEEIDKSFAKILKGLEDTFAGKLR